MLDRIENIFCGNVKQIKKGWFVYQKTDARPTVD